MCHHPFTTPPTAEPGGDGRGREHEHNTDQEPPAQDSISWGFIPARSVEALPVRQCGASDARKVIAMSVAHALAGSAGGGHYTFTRRRPQFTHVPDPDHVPAGHRVQLACPAWLNLLAVHTSHCTAAVLMCAGWTTQHTLERADSTACISVCIRHYVPRSVDLVSVHSRHIRP